MTASMTCDLNPELLAKYDGLRVPRYTSYPTAPHFTTEVGAETYRRWLGELDVGSHTGSLYLHIPFCRQLCWYCGCHTRIVPGYEPIAGYLGYLRGEIDRVADAIPGRLTVRHVHFGGGTPTMVSPQDYTALMEHLRARFDLDAGAEIAVEIDPRTLTEAMAEALGAAGVTRASLGVQDFDETVQEAINRQQPRAMTEQTLEWLRHAGIRHVNLDLMYGLPHQSVESVARSAEIALAMDPDRLAVFGYAHVPWMKKHQTKIDEAKLADSHGRWAQFAAISDRLMGAGYVPVGLDHFARPDDELAMMQREGRLNRNFQGYTTDDADVLLGFGASAIGALPQGYIQNAVPFHEYDAAIEAGGLATVKGLTLTDEDRLRRSVIERLMCDLAVDLEAVAARHGVAADHFDGDLARLADLETDGICTISGRVVRVPESARPLMRIVAAAFDTHLATGAGRHSKAI